MEVHVHSRQLTIRDNLREYAEEKLGKLQKVFPEILSAEIGFTRRSKNSGEDKYKVEVTLHCKSTIVRAEDDSTSPFAAIDFVSEKLERQLKRHKGRMYHNLSREAKRHTQTLRTGEYFAEEIPEGSVVPGAAEAALSASPEPVLVEDPEDIEEADGLPLIVRSKRFAMKPMSAPEAAMQMDLLGHDFYVFSNPESGAMNVVYRRRDGHFGLIEPEA
ncbi:MAG: Ribosome hibernation promotion factor [bacterium]|nr:Ribosome hibernation promotion factor [bacterium]